MQSAQPCWAIEPKLLSMLRCGGGDTPMQQTDVLRDVLAQAVGRRGKAEEAGC